MPWYEQVPAVTFDVDCEGGPHDITWSQGEVVLGQHPEVAAERALVALGGVKPKCLEILDLWELAIRDGGFIEEWAPWHTADRQRRWWLVTALERLRSEGVQDFLYDLPREQAAKMGEASVTLPHEFLDRAMATVVDAADQRGWDVNPALSRHLAEATRLRARRAFVKALSNQRPAIPSPALIPFRCQIELLEEPQVRGCLAGRDSSVEISLHPHWLSRVWARGVAVYDGRFTVNASETKDSVVLTQVHWTGNESKLDPHITTHQL
ncbi:MAG: hypothetical protein VX795_04220 [Actinomycetota bacterium]|nr:hypothetical protein [Actinomycetota bacterium]